MAGPGPNRFYSSVAVQTTLNGGISAGNTSMNVASTTGFPVSVPYTLSIDQNTASEELVTVTLVAGLTLTITRATDGTSAILHNNGATVVHVMSARDLSEPQAHLGAYDNVHGVTGLVVGTTDAQNLTNKTLTAPVLSGTVTGTYTLGGTPTITSPAISNPSITGTVAGGASYTAITLTSPVTSGTSSGTYTSSAVVTHTGTDKDLLVANSVTGNVALTVNALNGTSVDIADVKLNGTTLVSVNSKGGVNMSPTDTATVPLVVNAPSGGTDAFRAQVNAVTKWAVANGGNLVSTGTTTAVDLTANTGVKPVIGPGLLAYSPTWASTGVAPVVNNGTLSGGYIQYGKQTHVEFYLIMGSTTTFGTGSYTFSLPLAAFNYALIPGWLYDSSAAAFYQVYMANQSAGSTTSFVFRAATAGDATGISGTVPVTLAVGDIIFFSGYYQATS